MTISTTYFREHLAEVISKVADRGENVVLVFGKGKNAKKVSLNQITSSKVKKEKNGIEEFLESDAYKNHKVNPKFQKAKDFKEIMDKYYDINDFVA